MQCEPPYVNATTAIIVFIILGLWCIGSYIFVKYVLKEDPFVRSR
jgi:hypothetical protein